MLRYYYSIFKTLFVEAFTVWQSIIKAEKKVKQLVMEIDFERVNATQNPLKGGNSFRSCGMN